MEERERKRERTNEREGRGERLGKRRQGEMRATMKNAQRDEREKIAGREREETRRKNHIYWAM